MDMHTDTNKETHTERRQGRQMVGPEPWLCDHRHLTSWCFTLFICAVGIARTFPS